MVSIFRAFVDRPSHNELRLKFFFFQNLQENGINMQERLPMAQFTSILNNMAEKFIRMPAKYFYEILTKRRNL